MSEGAWFEGLLQRTFGNTPFLKGDAADYLLALIIAVVIPIFRYIADSTIHDFVARRIVPKHRSKKGDAKDHEADVEKFKESMYKVEIQITLSTVLLLVLTQHRWSSDTRLFWSECYLLPCRAAVSMGERFVYCLELGYYVQAIPVLFLWETKRKDRLETFAHHVATIALIGYSYYLNLTRVGVMVLICHEMNDIFLEAAKMGRYAESDFFATLFFVVFASSWFVTRIYAFPAYVIRSTLLESKHYGKVFDVDIEPHYKILNGFLIFLLVLHIYWSYLILRIIVRQFTHGELDDVRELEEEAAAAAAAGPAANTRQAERLTRRRAAAKREEAAEDSVESIHAGI